MKRSLFIVGLVMFPLTASAVDSPFHFGGGPGFGGGGSSGGGGGQDCAGLPDYGLLTDVLMDVVDLGAEENAGLGNDMWATVVNRDGQVCVVTYSGQDRSAQWPGSRVISAQKANTANAFSLSEGDGGPLLPGLALSTANLWAATQPGGSLFGLQFSNPVDTAVAYGNPSHAGGGNPGKYGRQDDPLVGRFVGGINVFGGGLALYDDTGEVIGGLGLSGDTSCSDHIQAWKVRDMLEFDHVPVGVSPTGDDNIIFDLSDDVGGNPESAGGFGHPTCLDAPSEEAAADVLPNEYPTGPNP